MTIEMEFSSQVDGYVAIIDKLRQSNRKFSVYLLERENRGEDSLTEILRKPALRSFLYAALLQVRLSSPLHHVGFLLLIFAACKELLGCTEPEHPDRKPLERITNMLLPLVNSTAHGKGDSRMETSVTNTIPSHRAGSTHHIQEALPAVPRPPDKTSEKRRSLPPTPLPAVPTSSVPNTIPAEPRARASNTLPLVPPAAPLQSPVQTTTPSLLVPTAAALPTPIVLDSSTLPPLPPHRPLLQQPILVQEALTIQDVPQPVPIEENSTAPSKPLPPPPVPARPSSQMHAAPSSAGNVIQITLHRPSSEYKLIASFPDLVPPKVPPRPNHRTDSGVSI